jgi:hypothetical protein
MDTEMLYPAESFPLPSHTPYRTHVKRKKERKIERDRERDRETARKTERERERKKETESKRDRAVYKSKFQMFALTHNLLLHESVWKAIFFLRPKRNGIIQTRRSDSMPEPQTRPQHQAVAARG